MHHTLPATRRVALVAAVAALTLAAGACGSSESPAADASPTGAALVVDDGWVKAVDETASPSASSSLEMDMSSPSPSASGMDGMDGMDMSMPMSAMFGTLRNTTDEDITIEGGSTPAAEMVELHETVKNASGEMQMQPKQGGFVVPAGGTYVLKPGGDHVMLMGLTGALRNGAEVSVTLRTSAGEFALTVPVRAFSGAEETYEPSPSS
ncbi:copper chaperone PCu(A)C [Phycicoccus sonneratiae]|uniref:Copper chaperone PCu(A)C n=1 Tax=Phycicoccus sonneratiae TaxID=2807628 RepID=A0ABS2CMF6_9MICO|nr:copper chaperone PCu(A)C [Phycicoccus sonneraticus]MBM6400361.1 copper chaperone PCu(A)C [Phycicoccus sonneraticus]